MSELSVQTGALFSQLVEGRRCPNRFLGFGGIAQSVAALIGKGSLYHAYHPYTEKIEQREIGFT